MDNFPTVDKETSIKSINIINVRYLKIRQSHDSDDYMQQSIDKRFRPIGDDIFIELICSRIH